MTEFKVGDRVKVEFEGHMKDTEFNNTRILVDDGFSGTWVLRESATKLAPELPTKEGTVIDSHGYRFILTTRGWHPTTDKDPYPMEAFKASMYARDFTVVLEGN
jgi:hypothetical protein